MYLSLDSGIFCFYIYGLCSSRSSFEQIFITFTFFKNYFLGCILYFFKNVLKSNYYLDKYEVHQSWMREFLTCIFFLMHQMFIKLVIWLQLISFSFFFEILEIIVKVSMMCQWELNYGYYDFFQITNSDGFNWVTFLLLLHFPLLKISQSLLA